MKKLLLVAFQLICFISIYAQINIHSAINFGASDDQYGKKVVVDNASSAILLIDYINTATIGAQIHSEGSINGTALAKYTGMTLDWSANILAEEANSICTDSSNNIYIVGYGSTDSVIYMGPNDTVSFRNLYQGIYWDGPFLIKLSSGGDFIYGRYFNHGSGAFTNVSKAHAIKADNEGHLYISGDLQFFFFYDNGDSTRINGPSDKLFLAQLDANTGGINWAGFVADVATGNGRGHINDLTVIDDRYVFFTGDFTNDMMVTDFATDSIMIISTNNIHEDIFIAGFDSSGRVLNARSYGGTGKDIAVSIAASDTDHIYIGGWFDSPGLVLDSTTIPSPGMAGEYDGFIIRLNYDVSTNTWLDEFGVEIGPDGISHVNSLDVDEYGNVYATGDFDQQLEFGTDVLLPDGNGREVYFIILDDLGNKLVWQKAGNAPGSSAVPQEHDEGFSIAVSGLYSACITGRISTTDGLFGGIVLTTTGDADVFLGKIDQASGISSFEDNNSLTIYPNPATDFILIHSTKKLNYNSDLKLKISDINGRMIYAKHGRIENSKINISNLENGVYFISLVDSSSINIQGKFVKSK